MPDRAAIDATSQDPQLSLCIMTPAWAVAYSRVMAAILQQIDYDR